jgi:hypothetical protein
MKYRIAPEVEKRNNSSVDFWKGERGFFAQGYSSPSYQDFFLIYTILHLNTLGNLRSVVGFHENNVKVDQSLLNMNFL